MRLALLWLSVFIAAQPPNLKVTLLGTTGPAPQADRAGPGILVEAGSEKFLFDCGRGTTQRIAELTVPYRDASALFLTHLHSDHIIGIPDLWLTGWFLGRDVPFRVWGPAGTREMMTNLEKAYEFDIRVRTPGANGLPRLGVTVVGRDIDEGVIYESGGIKITAFQVDHGRVRPALGYRLEYAGRSVVISGDTRVSDNLARYSENADLLLWDVGGNFPGLFSPPEEVGTFLTRVKPRLTVYTHYANADAMRSIQYTGPAVAGEDLMSFEVGDQVTARRFDRRPPQQND
jgi:ribonuclease Z